MPPKKQDKNKPPPAEEDLSDLSTLPHISTYTCLILTDHFYIHQHKSQVKSGIKEALSEQPETRGVQNLKMLTRESIQEAAQGKAEFKSFS